MVNGSKSLVQEQMRFGAWNIRTMSGREIELVEEGVVEGRRPRGNPDYDGWTILDNIYGPT